MATPFCPNCDYNLTGLPQNRCPECGRMFDPTTVLDEMPRPITPLHVAAYTLWAPLLVTACVFLVRFLGAFVGFLLPLGIIPALVFGPLHAVDAAERMAVTRALREGGIRSGRQDRAYIFTWTAVLAAAELLTAAAGLFAVLLTK